MRYVRTNVELLEKNNAKINSFLPFNGQQHTFSHLELNLSKQFLNVVKYCHVTLFIRDFYKPDEVLLKSGDAGFKPLVRHRQSS